jgi:DNA primase
MIDQATVDRIFDAADIVEVVQDYVSLKKRGVNYLGLCPFHGEKTPSFTVSPAKGIYKCFGCGKGGNSVTFIMEHEHLSYYEALKHLAHKYHIEIVEQEVTPEEIQRRNENESLLIISNFASQYFSDMLLKHEEGKSIGLSYFRERGVRDDMITRFQLGYSLEQRDAFTREAQKRGYKQELLVKTGLSIDGEHSAYDRFSGRVMFPIHGISGKVIGFGGRILKNDKKFAKYLNSPESDIFHKGKILYGLYFAKTAIQRADRCYLVEGYLDVIGMHQAGIENVVASCGTSLTQEHVKLIRRFTSNLTVIYDGDNAGIEAARKATRLCLEEGLNVRILLLPDGHDPDSFAREHSATEVVDYIAQNETDFIIFNTRLALKEASNDPVKRANLITELAATISLIPETITRSVYIKECSRILDIDESVVLAQVSRIRRQKAEQKYKGLSDVQPEEVKIPQAQVYTHHDSCEAQEREIIRILLTYGNQIFETIRNEEEPDGETHVSIARFVINELVNDGLEITNPLFRQIFEEIHTTLADGGEINERSFTQHADAEVCKLAADLLAPQYTLSKIWTKHNSEVEDEQEKLHSLVTQTLLAFKNKKIVQLLKLKYLELVTAQTHNDLDAVNEVQESIMQINNHKKEFSKILNDRIILE